MYYTDFIPQDHYTVVTVLLPVSDELPELVVCVRGVKVVSVDEVAEGAPVRHVQEDLCFAQIGAHRHVRIEVFAGVHETGPEKVGFIKLSLNYWL